MKNFKEYIFNKLIDDKKLLIRVWKKTVGSLKYNPYWQHPLPILYNFDYVVVNDEVIDAYCISGKCIYSFRVHADGRIFIFRYFKETDESILDLEEMHLEEREVVKAFFMYSFRRAITSGGAA